MKLRPYILAILMLLPTQVYANTEPISRFRRVKNFFGSIIRGAGNYFSPGLGDKAGAMLGLGGGIEEELSEIQKQVILIGEAQETTMDKIQKIARDAIAAKRKMEDIYYYKKEAQRNAEYLINDLKNANASKVLGVLAEDFLDISLNPADYLPDTDLTREMRHNLNLDLSLEAGMIKSGKSILRGTRKALVESGAIKKMSSSEFKKALKKAEEYEEQLLRGIELKKEQRIKVDQEKLKQTRKEIKALIKSKKMKGIKPSDVLAIEQTIELKESKIDRLERKIDEAMKNSLTMNDKDAYKSFEKANKQDSIDMFQYWVDYRKNLREKNKHLFPF